MALLGTADQVNNDLAGDMMLLVPAIESHSRVLTRRGVVVLGTVADLDANGRSQGCGADRSGNVQGDPLESGSGGLGGVAGPDQDLLDALEGDHEDVAGHRGLRTFRDPIVLVNSKKEKRRF